MGEQLPLALHVLPTVTFAAPTKISNFYGILSIKLNCQLALDGAFVAMFAVSNIIRHMQYNAPLVYKHQQIYWIWRLFQQWCFWFFFILSITFQKLVVNC